jgi:hypothetical protein
VSEKEQTPKPEPDESKKDYGQAEDNYPRTLAELLEKFSKKKKEKLWHLHSLC